MIRQSLTPFLFLLLPMLTAGLLSSPTSPVRPPNVVLIFMDDMGYGDLSCYGALGYTTPHIDRLAMEGTRFTNFLTAQAVCTASRTALLTGCYPNRVGMSGALPPWATTGLHPDEETLAELLKERGYATGIFGKWHLGHHPAFMPRQQGFDEYVGLPYSNDMWPINYDGTPATSGNKARYPPLPLIDDDAPVDTVWTLADQDRLTERLTGRAVAFINKHRKAPFFLYLPHHMPHVPIGASAKFRGKTGEGLYADMMQEIDWSVSEVMQALKTNGLEKNTLVIFTSDNGPWLVQGRNGGSAGPLRGGKGGTYEGGMREPTMVRSMSDTPRTRPWLTFGDHAGSSGGLREGKGTTYEGGHRVPCLMRWPGVVPAGRVCNKLLTTMDVLPTVASVCGARLPRRAIDGVNAVALLKGDERQTPRTEFYYYYRTNSLEAVRRGNSKLVFAHPGRRDEGYARGKDGSRGQNTENYAVEPGLYDLRHDPGERYDLSTQRPELKADLDALAEKARADLGDDLQQRRGANVRPGGQISDLTPPGKTN